MIDLKRLFQLGTALLLFASLSTNAQNMGDTLQVGVAGSEPFFINEAGQYDGIAPTIWEDVAVQADILFEYRKCQTIPTALDSLHSGELDMVVGPVSIVSPRIQRFDFSQPYYISSLSILAKEQSPSLWQRVKPFFTKRFFVALAIFLLILTIVGFLFWITEKRVNTEEFPSDPVKGIGSGIWLALVTMTTVGYGDKAPQTLAGRVVSGVWMIISLLSATSLVAGIASVLTLSGSEVITINSAKDLDGIKVAALENGPASQFVNSNDGKITPVNSMSEGIRLLKDDEVDAIVYDTPQLQYYLQEHPDAELKLSDKTYRPQGYGFAFKTGAPVLKRVNTQLLKLREQGITDEIVHRWLKEIEE